MCVLCNVYKCASMCCTPQYIVLVSASKLLYIALLRLSRFLRVCNVIIRTQHKNSAQRNTQREMRYTVVFYATMCAVLRVRLV